MWVTERLNRCVRASTSGSLLSVLLLVSLLPSCTSLPSLEGRSSTQALSESKAVETDLGTLVAQLVEANEGHSAVHLLVNPHEAFAARTRLAKAAERTLDIQYYIWRPDTTGMLLFDAIQQAADRGVRVRLLLDDYNTSDMDALLAALHAHENIEIRLFNPFMVRQPRFWEMLTDLPRINRRMHNKTFTVDNSMTVLGGRNVADEYFGATDMLFADLDVLVLGPVVREVSSAFDRYWRSDSAYPVDRVLEQVGTPPDNEVRQSEPAKEYLDELDEKDPIAALHDGELSLCWTKMQLVVDDPAKGLGEAEGDELFWRQLQALVNEPRSRLDLLSSYFIPTRAGVDKLTELTSQGVRVQVLTNSMAATDVALVHSGYAKWRKELLEGGVALYEMKRGDDGPSSTNISSGPYDSARSTLHAKAFAVDGKQLVVGSFNADPRSVHLNTEIGLVIDCPKLAEKIHGAFPDGVMKHAYEVRLDEGGDLYWLALENGEMVRHDTEPNTTFRQRFSLPFFSILPIDWLL